MPFIVFLFFFMLVYILVVYAWWFFLLCGAVALGIWAINRTTDSYRASVDRNNKSKLAVAARADREHALIMAGNEVLGTFGQYLPPQEFRYIGPTLPDESEESTVPETESEEVVHVTTWGGKVVKKRVGS